MYLSLSNFPVLNIFKIIIVCRNRKKRIDQILKNVVERSNLEIVSFAVADIKNGDNSDI